MKILLVGGGGREHSIASALCRNPAVQLFTVMANESPGIADLSREWLRHVETDVPRIVEWAASKEVDFAVVGFEDPLAVGLCDALETKSIPAFGPKQAAAQLETSKAFARDLMRKHGIAGQVDYSVFRRTDEVRAFLRSTSRLYAVKPTGLSAGKGVRIMGEQLKDAAEAADYACEIIEKRIGGEGAVILEERLEGEEFTLQCFVDGSTVVPMPLVQDYKRLLEGNKGPNTGSMGSYSQPDGLLPFLSRIDYDAALGTIRDTIKALRQEGVRYTGVLYGQFILTTGGPRLVEFNARFGDPEAMNVLALLETDLATICRAVIDGRLDSTPIRFAAKATVCKYVVPRGYGSNPEIGARLRLRPMQPPDDRVRFYIAKVNREDGELATTSSRALAVLGIGDSIEHADQLAEQGLRCVDGPHYVRHDIGRVTPASKPLYSYRSDIQAVGG